MDAKKHACISFAIALLLLTASCGESATPRATPTCSPGGNCPGTGYLAVAQPNGISLFLAPFSGAAHAAIEVANVESFAKYPTVDTPSTWLAAVPPNKLYTFDYPYASPDGSVTIPVNDISQIGFVAAPSRLLVADAVSNDLALVDLSANPPAVTKTVGGLNHPTAFGFDGQGRLWVAEASDVAILTVQSDGTFTRAATLSSGLSAPAGISGYFDGTMYVSDSANNAIEVYPPNATAPAFAITAGLAHPHALLPYSANTLLVANTGDNSIAAFALPLTASSTPLWINHNLTGTPRALAPWFSPSF